ncbi:hypothetical protein MAA_11598 [Metarhizium robertsii ARSEF 23]|uniref:Uncharacterized protein n=1 Tax=Metarhizium robertsii (strain ARSEF 23 / ATCC MYA-3075) TaxID=655844 RepID=A0A0B2XGZ9_METRA|nr:uncharacterized protein MAA_11598 [Metarhizium robertsii ARSEF 23]KHO10837.1 hypothetical protein MAA_11598 [Metarhizium robertsii ARSEF 23]
MPCSTTSARNRDFCRTSSTFVVIAFSGIRRGDSKTGTFKPSGSPEEIGEGVGLASADADWTGNNLAGD